MSKLLQDWKTQGREKLAAMTATNMSDIEKAFADQASGYVENALGPLMQDQYRVGFEIVKANEDNTRICGVFAFKVDKDLLFAIVFFINGAIKGPILYRCDRKTFVPANKEWANYLIENIEMHEGKGISRMERGKNPPLVQMQRLLMVPGPMGKQAAAEDDGELIERKDKVEVENEMRNEKLHKKLDKEEFSAEFAKRFNKKFGNKYKKKKAAITKIAEHTVQEANVQGCLCHQLCPKNISECGDKNPEDIVTGAYKVKDYKQRYCVPGRLSNGEYVLKVAAWDDGTLRVGDYMLTTEDAANIQKEAAFAITIPDTATIYVPAAGASMLKRAFFDNVPDYTGTWFKSLFDGCQYVTKEAHLIKELVQDEDYGETTVQLLQKAAAGDKGFNFADSLAACYGTPENLLEYIGKKASKKEKPADLEIVYDPDKLPKADGRVPEQYWKDGFFVLDRRPEESLSVVYNTMPDELSFPKDTGVYSVLQENGEFLENVLISRPADVDAGYSHYTGWRQDVPPWDGGSGSGEHQSNHYILVHDGKARLSHGCMCIQTGFVKDYPGVVERPEAKKLYFIYVPGSHNLLGPIAVDDVRRVDGVTYASVWGLKEQPASHTHMRAVWDDEAFEVETNANNLSDITVNPDVEDTDIQDGVFGKGVLFIPLDRDNKKRIQAFGTNWRESVEILPQQLGNIRAIDNWMFGKFGVRKATLKYEMGVTGAGEKKAYWTLHSDGSHGRKMTKVKAMVKLARDCGIGVGQAYDLLEKAASCKDGVSFGFAPGELYKEASQYHLLESPSFDQEFDPELGVSIMPEQTFKLRVGGTQQMPQPAVVGEHRAPTPTGLPNLTVVNTDPEELRTLADTYNLPNVFEHGVVGTLAGTFDAMRLVDRYLPMLEQGVDALGRIKFLIHWCPTDFERAYGTDEMLNFEAENDSTFNALGALFLKLTKQNERQKKEESKLMGDEIIE